MKRSIKIFYTPNRLQALHYRLEKSRIDFTLASADVAMQALHRPTDLDNQIESIQLNSYQ